ncbi:large-conductance mechanosensitive channel [Proteiniborus sp. DW1]|uniref:large-conductance mechanosensitive channel protein MscL n=1 Tax=Proteiniborus sp. DW1 TaxID=1889883 RepID=UPI00092E0AAB|nr:large-conductance mechanosensitive channel protein MscL [Proteiniborus sp. DW1]SCG84240.1 large-conductance mechanosensitive channel [Proteiniborus sp. DW1]
MLKEFKKFAMRGNVVDLAVGVIIGGAFGKIVTSLVNDVIMPLLGLLLGGINFAEDKLLLREASGTTEALYLNYGQFVQSVIDFLIISFSIFLFIKAINSVKKKEEKPKPAEPTKEEILLTEIRDLLRERK